MIVAVIALGSLGASCPWICCRCIQHTLSTWPHCGTCWALQLGTPLEGGDTLWTQGGDTLWTCYASPKTWSGCWSQAEEAGHGKKTDAKYHAVRKVTGAVKLCRTLMLTAMLTLCIYAVQLCRTLMFTAMLTLCTKGLTDSDDVRCRLSFKHVEKWSGVQEK